MAGGDVCRWKIVLLLLLFLFKGTLLLDLL